MKASEIVSESYIGLELDGKVRRQLAQQFPPKYPNFIGHHITWKFGIKKDYPLPKNIKTIEVVGYADDGESIEALVVEVNGSTQRSDGKTYHITWSLDRSKGKSPRHSNNLIQDQGWQKLDTPIKISATPKML